MRFSIERLSVTSSETAGVGHDEGVLARGPGEDVEEDLLDVLLHRREQLVGIDSLHLHQDGAEAASRADLAAGLEVLPAR